MFLEVYPQVLGVSTLRRCSKCGEYKSLDLFSPDVNSKGKLRLSSYCRDCAAARQRKYRAEHQEAVHKSDRKSKEKRRDAVREYNRLRYLEMREEVCEYQRQYRESNAENIRKQRRAFRAANSDRLREKSKRYYSLNPEVFRTNNMRRRARKSSLSDTINSSDWQFALNYFGGCCAVCGRQQGLWHTLAADHWIPLSKGGPTTPDNIVPLCHGDGGCNNSKGSRDAGDWLVSKFGPRKGRAIQRRIETFLNSRKPTDEDRD